MTVEIRATQNNTSQKTGNSNKMAPTKAPQGGGAARASGKMASGDDTVNLTNSATQLQALAAQIAELPVADTRLVSEVQVSLATGTFQVAPVKVANNMLTQEKEFAQLEAQE